MAIQDDQKVKLNKTIHWQQIDVQFTDHVHTITRQSGVQLHATKQDGEGRILESRKDE